MHSRSSGGSMRKRRLALPVFTLGLFVSECAISLKNRKRPMKKLRFCAAALGIVSFVSLAMAQNTPRYLDTSLAPEERAADLVGRMKLEEKASQMVNQS